MGIFHSYVGVPESTAPKLSKIGISPRNKLDIINMIPVVPHKPVAEVSKIGNL